MARPGRVLAAGWEPGGGRGAPGSPPLAGLSGRQRWLWKTLDPRVIRPGPGLESGAPATPTQTLCPSPTCPSLRARLSQRLPACGRKLW